MAKIKDAWLRFSIDRQERFKNISPEFACTSLDLINLIARSSDEADLRDILPPDQKATPLAITRYANHGNCLETLPYSLGNLVNLVSLDLSFNRLFSLPDSIGNLCKLSELNLGFNKLSLFPDTFCKLTALEQLYLNNNRITSLPGFLVDFRRLRVLDIRENPFTIDPRLSLLLLKLRENGCRIFCDSAIEDGMERYVEGTSESMNKKPNTQHDRS